MPQAIVKPEDLRKFSAQMLQFQEELQEMSQRLLAQSERLAETWRDQEHDKFKQEFDQSVQPLHLILDAAERYSQFLLRKAEAADRYIEQK